MSELSPEAREFKRAYRKAWREKNKERIKEQDIQYWERKAKAAREESEKQTEESQNGGNCGK